ncbi:uncharacterized protein LOC110878374 isoform X2 [Helianthus annuus]|uniref:uncharacterized protein LOC110878374 isoform X2 n=1 Tax=Helianthus annuus TaxID=4232 RepID=UPI000B907D24|nr:uncharacterized protein LOC110878374 isoform X2 [Helianthus annuus]
MYSSAGTISLRSVCSSFHCCRLKFVVEPILMYSIALNPSRMHQLQGFWECYAPPMVKLDQKKRIQCVRVRDDQEHSVKTILDLLKHSARFGLTSHYFT